ncbi:phytoene/squalene synthase family protein [uncultured Paracoccus sp.]|uniref:phytoene/squalene synthase family protein n=1 Tax=uncultured Paracoccus sp. TaxID=189685 RepID=UPI0026075A71|nr:phytoene/squalene synthase family protein [uncultured Paracoccus sp.]
MTAAPATDHRLARDSGEVIRKGSKSFAAASLLMPAAMRQDTVMLYAWCRYADDVIDGQDMGGAGLTPPDAAERLQALRADTLRALHGDGPVPAPFQALRHVARRHDFPDRWPLDLIDGFAMDVAGRRYATAEDTLRYCYHVAGVVGVMMARVMGVRDDAVLDRACDLGLAFQMTNIARDVMDDARMGRVYLPGEWLDGAVPDPRAATPPAAVHAATLRLLDMAEPYYASARIGLAALPYRAAWSIAAALRIYRAIGLRIRSGGPEAYRRRIGTTLPTKLALITAAKGDALRSRRAVQMDVARDGLWTRPH